MTLISAYVLSYCSTLGAVVLASPIRAHVWLLCLGVNTSVLQANHTITNLVRANVSDTTHRSCQRSFTYIFYHCWFGVLLELEQDNVNNRHLEDPSKLAFGSYFFASPSRGRLVI